MRRFWGVLLGIVGITRMALAAEGPGPADWPQWGATAARNNVSPAKKLPVTWDIGQIDHKTGLWKGSADKQIRWVAKLGSESYATPVVAGGKVFVATNNAGYLPRYPEKIDLGCLVCFSAADGKFLWQLAREKLAGGKDIDWPKQGICSTPVVEGDRLWIVTNRGEVMCLDTEGFADGENDGPVQDEPASGAGEADVVWSVDMMSQFHSVQRYMASCSPTIVGDLVLVGTSNGVNVDDELPAPEAPSFLALDKRTGKTIWTDNSPGRNILEGQWASPAGGSIGGTAQAIFGGGDGWLYSFQAAATADGKPQSLWTFDCNPKNTVWESGGSGTRNYLIGTPVIVENRVYVATGLDPEAGEGPGDLWCLDATKRGDLSAEVVVDQQGRPAPRRRVEAVDKDAGERAQPNPNSAVVWHYQGHDANADGKREFKESMHRALGSPAIADGLLVIGDFAGLIHGLDAASGRVLWTHDAMAAIWGSPLLADGKIYIGTEDGDILVLQLGREAKVLAKNNMHSSVYGTPIVAGGVLYVATQTHLFAIGGP